jgi:PucR family transcriptional regulator, purine catabolism regulatory protein
MGKVANDPLDAALDLPARASCVPADAENGHVLTVWDVLRLPSLAGARVVAGESGMSRVVQRVNVMELPDIMPWVKPRELLLTTGYPLRNTPQALVALVSELDEHGLSALAIKLHRYIDELPEAMLAEANRRGFPVLVIPDEVSFDDVLNQVLTGVIDRQAAMRERAEEVHRVLVQVVLDGGGPDELAEKLAGLLTGPVLVTTSDGRMIARAGDPDMLAAALASTCFDASGRFCTELEPAGAHGHAGLDGVHIVVPILVGHVDHGRILAFSGARVLGDADVHTLERAATVAALAITKQQEVAAVESKYRGDFLRDLITGRLEDPVRAVAHCAALGWDINRPLVVVVAEMDDEDAAKGNGAGRRPAQQRFASAWETAVRLRDPKAPVMGFLREVVALLAVPPRGDSSALVRDIVREVSGDGGGRRLFATGVSRVAAGPDEIPTAYGHARSAVRVARQRHGPGGIAHFDDLGVFRVLSLIPDATELRDFAAETLGELVNFDAPEMDDLRRTLEVLLETNLNIAEAARALHFHYNTLRYRIARLERILGRFTKDADLRLELALALKVIQMQSLPA